MEVVGIGMIHLPGRGIPLSVSILTWVSFQADLYSFIPRIGSNLALHLVQKLK